MPASEEREGQVPNTARLIGERDIICSKALFPSDTAKPSRCNTAEPSVSHRHGLFFERIVAAE